MAPLSHAVACALRGTAGDGWYDAQFGDGTAVVIKAMHDFGGL